MTIDQYWNVLLKRWRLILICFLLIGMIAYLGSRLISPQYRSTALVQISVRSDNNQADINSLLASDQLVQTEAQLAVSDPVLREVASHYAGMTVEQLNKNVSTAPKPNTQLFSIDTLASNPQRAADLANDIALTLIKQQNLVEQQNNMQSQKQIQQDLQQTQGQIDKLTAQLQTAKESNQKDAVVSTLQTKFDDLQQHYRQWQSLLAQIELSEAQSGSFLRVAQSAQVITKPAQPDILLNTSIGLIAGLFAGLVLTILLEQVDTRVRSEEMLFRLTDWPLLTTIWRQTSPKKNRNLDDELVNPPEHNTNVESYRILRTNIGSAMLNKPVRSILVISATPHDGKSVVSANLAIFMARAGKKTLLIDADLRRPTLAKKFHLSPDQMGLSNAINACEQHLLFSSSNSPQKPATRPFSLEAYMHEVDIPNLYVMPSGPLPANPPEMLDSKAMNYFFTALGNCPVDTIIFDTPPLLGLSDASILAPKIDGVLVVVDITTASKKNLERVKTLLTQSKSYILGCVVNKHSPSRTDMTYAYAYYGSAKEQKTSSEKEKKQPVTSPQHTPHALLPVTNSDLPSPGVTHDQPVAAVQPGQLRSAIQPAPLALPAPEPITDQQVEYQPRPRVHAQLRQQEGYLTVDPDIRLHYQIMGSGTDVVIVPAASWLAADFTPLIHNRTIIFYDQRGRGQSDPVTDPTYLGMQYEISDIEALCHHFQLTAITLIGWSYLGGVAARYAMLHTDTVKRLILINPTSIRSHQYADERLLNPDLRVDPDEMKRVEKMRAAGLDLHDPAVYNREYAKIVRLPRQMGNPLALARMRSDPWSSPNEWPAAVTTFFAHFAASLPAWDWRADASQLHIPALIVHGTEDLIPLASSQDWAATLPEARLLPLSDAGHYPWLEKPEAFFPAIEHFLQGDWPAQAAPVRETAVARKI